MFLFFFFSLSLSNSLTKTNSVNCFILCRPILDDPRNLNTANLLAQLRCHLRISTYLYICQLPCASLCFCFCCYHCRRRRRNRCCCRGSSDTICYFCSPVHTTFFALIHEICITVTVRILDSCKWTTFNSLHKIWWHLTLLIWIFIAPALHPLVSSIHWINFSWIF